MCPSLSSSSSSSSSPSPTPSGSSWLEEQMCLRRTVRARLLQTAAATTPRPGRRCRPTGASETRTAGGAQRRNSSTGPQGWGSVHPSAAAAAPLPHFVTLCNLLWRHVIYSLNCLKVSPFFTLRSWSSERRRAWPASTVCVLQWHRPGPGEGPHPLRQRRGQPAVPRRLQVHLGKLRHLAHEHRQEHHAPAGQWRSWSRLRAKWPAVTFVCVCVCRPTVLRLQGGLFHQHLHVWPAESTLLVRQGEELNTMFSTCSKYHSSVLGSVAASPWPTQPHQTSICH